MQRSNGRLVMLFSLFIAAMGHCPAVVARQVDCTPLKPETFTVDFPLLGDPPDEEGLGWDRPPVWEGHPASSDSMEVPNGRPIYALFVSGYRQNAYFDELIFYRFARHLMARDAYVHFAWWNNLLAPYMARPLHYSQSHPGTEDNLLNFANPAQAADKAVPGEDYQFVADAKRFLRAIREHNPSAIIIVVGHSMGGGAVVHLATQIDDVVIDIAAPIDPVGNRNYPWAGPAFQNANHYNWTRWRVTRDNFRGYRSRYVIPPLGSGCEVCEPCGEWLANIAETQGTCFGGPHIDDPGEVRFGANVVNLYHRWQHEYLFPFDFEEEYRFSRTRPPGGSSEQSAVTTRDDGNENGGWPQSNDGGTCCPVGQGIAWPRDGHGEIVGFRGLLPRPEPLGVRVNTSPNCESCGAPSWPARTLGDRWGNGNVGLRRTYLEALEALEEADDKWDHEPYNPSLCLVSQGLIDLFDRMNTLPVANAGSDQTVTCTGCKSADVTLDGSGSSDPDAGDGITAFRWTWNLGSATGAVASINLPLGSHCITLEVEDENGHVARDVVVITVEDTSAVIVPFTSLATAWRTAAGEYEARAFDEFYPGIPDATGCLSNSPTVPTILSLARGTLAVTAYDGGEPSCTISDASTAPAVSDAYLDDDRSRVVFEFDPAISAFYTYYGSLATGRTATMALYDATGAPIDSMTTPPSTHASRAAGQGFTSDIPVARIEFSTNEPGPVLIGAFTGLRPGEQSLGTVEIDDYEGPDGSRVIQLDFACTFVEACSADFNDDGAANSQDYFDYLAAFFSKSPAADFNRDGVINSQDYFDFLAAFFVGC